VSFASITLCVASQRVFIVVYFVIDSVRKLSDTPTYIYLFLFDIASILALGPTQPSIQWVPGALTPGIRRLGLEANHSPPSSPDDKNTWSYTSIPPIRLQASCFVKHRTHLHGVIGG
jgi:hypothetical protein